MQLTTNSVIPHDKNIVSWFFISKHEGGCRNALTETGYLKMENHFNWRFPVCVLSPSRERKNGMEITKPDFIFHTKTTIADYDRE